MLQTDWEARVDTLQTALEAMPPDEATVRALVDVCVGVVLAATNSPQTAQALLTAALTRHTEGWSPMAPMPTRLQ